jgi:hypothetical protein
MAKVTTKKDKFITEALNSYFDALYSIGEFERWIYSECQRTLKEHLEPLREEMGIVFDSSKVEPFEHQLNEEAVWIGSTIYNKSREDYICVGLKCGQGIRPKAFASLHVGPKKSAEKLCEELKNHGGEPEEDDGWYVSIYQELSQLSQPGFETALRSVLRKWCSGRGKVQRFLRANR